MTEYEVTSSSADSTEYATPGGAHEVSRGIPQPQASRAIPREMERRNQPPEIDTFCRNCSLCA